MRRVAVVLLGLCLVLPMSTAAAQKPPRYRGFLVCSAKKTAEPAATCGKNKKKTAVFLSKDRDVTYKVCVKFPDGTRLCAADQHAEKGVRSGNAVTVTQPGTVKATWYVAGEKVATARMQVTG
jgi:hypothetical protein